MVLFKKYWLKVAVMTVVCTFLGACNTVKGTVEGMGKDVQSVTGSGKSNHDTQTSQSSQTHKKNTNANYNSNSSN